MIPRGWLWKVLQEVTSTTSTAPVSMPPTSSRPLPSSSPSSPPTPVFSSSGFGASAVAMSLQPVPASRAHRLADALLFHTGLWHGLLRLPPGRRLVAGHHDLRGVLRLLTAVGDVVCRVANRLPHPRLSPTEALGLAVLATLGHPRWPDVDADPRARLRFLENALRDVEASLAARRDLAGNPLVGLSLHHAMVGATAEAWVQTATELVAFGRDAAWPARAATVEAHLQALRAAVVGGIAAISAVQSPMNHEVVRRATGWQLDHLGLPRRERKALMALARTPPDTATLAALVPLGRAGFVYAHLTLVARMDGRISRDERAVIEGLADACGLADAQRQRIRARALAVVDADPDAFSPVVLAEAFADADPPMTERLGRAVVDNADALLTEIRETGDLGVLLARLAAGQKLNTDERRRLRAQLIDVVRAVPSLAVVTLPGGLVLLPLLLRLLPFDLRPSAFRGETFRATEAGDDDDDPRARSLKPGRALLPPGPFRR